MTARVVVTRAESQAASLQLALREHGLDAVAVPAIAVEIDPPGGDLDRATRALQTFDWVVVTSPNGARAVRLAAARVRTSLGSPRWAAIGDSTARILEREAVDVEFRPSRADARTLAEELPLSVGQDVLLLRGDLAEDKLATRLRDRGATVHDVVAYRTTEAPASSRAMLRDAVAAGRPDAILLASGSAARGFLSLAKAEALDVRGIPAVCIGAETQREATRLGFEVLATSPHPDPATFAATAALALARPLEAR